MTLLFSSSDYDVVIEGLLYFYLIGCCEGKGYCYYEQGTT